jgi:uncharacterized protein with HEPN domain
MSKRIILFLLQDILACIETIGSYTNGVSYDQFINDIKTYQATLFNFHIIGEASAQIPKEYKVENSHINWNEVKAFRNKLIHEYFGTNNQIIWDVIKFDLPDLKTQIQQLIDKQL